MQPLRRYPMDAAILFSDILTVPDALGLGLYFEEGEGPRFRKTVRTESDLAGLNTIRADDDLAYVMRAVSTIRNELNGAVPLIGFAPLFTRGRGINFGLFQIASPIDRTKEWIGPTTEVHEVAAYALIALAVGHVAAAIYHQVALKDGVLLRMMR